MSAHREHSTEARRRCRACHLWLAVLAACPPDAALFLSRRVAPGAADAGEGRAHAVVKAGAERKIHNTSIEQEEFNRTIRDLRLQLQQSQRERDSLNAQAMRARDMEEIEITREQLRNEQHRVPCRVSFISNAGHSRGKAAGGETGGSREATSGRCASREPAVNHHEALKCTGEHGGAAQRKDRRWIIWND